MQNRRALFTQSMVTYTPLAVALATFLNSDEGKKLLRIETSCDYDTWLAALNSAGGSGGGGAGAAAEAEAGAAAPGTGTGITAELLDACLQGCKLQ
jgi:hypothetical protein